jgi:hypothetical protein
MSLYQLYIEHCTGGGGSPLALPRAQRQSQTHRPSERARAVRELSPTTPTPVWRRRPKCTRLLLTWCVTVCFGWLVLHRYSIAC